MACTYTITNPVTGETVVKEGLPEFKLYMFDGALEQLLPDYEPEFGQENQLRLNIKDEFDKKYNISGKYPSAGIETRKSFTNLIEGIYKGKNVNRTVSKDAEKLLDVLLDGDALNIKELSSELVKKYQSERTKMDSQVGTQRDRFVSVDTSKLELYRLARLAFGFVNDKLSQGLTIENVIAEINNSFPVEKISSSYNGTSYHGKKYAQAELDGLKKFINEEYNKAISSNPADEEKQKILTVLNSYAKEYINRTTRVANVRSGVLSSTIAGKSKFDNNQASKRGSAYDKANAEFTQWDTQATKQLSEDLKTESQRKQEQTEKDQKEQKNKNRQEELLKNLLEFKAGKSDFSIGNRKVIKVTFDKSGLPSSFFVEDKNNELTDNKFSVVPVIFKTKAELLEAVNRLKEQSSEVADKATENKVKEIIAQEHNSEQSSPIKVYDNIIDRLYNGNDVTEEEFKAAYNLILDNEDSIKSELGKLTKDQLMNGYARSLSSRSSDTKAELINTAYSRMLESFTLDEGFTWTYGEKRHDGITRVVNKINQAKLDDFKEKRLKAIEDSKQKAEQKKQGMANPQTLSDYVNILGSRIKELMAQGETYSNALKTARFELTPEQREQFDILQGENARENRDYYKESARDTVAENKVTTGAQIIKNRHAKKGIDIWVVKADDRVDSSVFKTWKEAASKLGGYYSMYRGNGAIAGFIFESEDAAQAFQKYISANDTEAVKEQAKVERDAFMDDKTQSTVERLNEMADRLEDRANEALNADRKVNTARRARMADASDAGARRVIAMANTMRNLANAIADKKVQFLDRVRQKTQVEWLDSFANNAAYNYTTALFDKAKKGEIPPISGMFEDVMRRNRTNVESADYAKFPSYTLRRSEWEKLGRQLLEVKGLNKVGKAILDTISDKKLEKDYLDFAKNNLSKVYAGEFKTKDGKLISVSSVKQANEYLDKLGYKGKLIAFKNGKDVVLIHSMPEAMRLGIFTPEDRNITLKSELVEKILSADLEKNYRIYVPWYLTRMQEEWKALKRMGLETPSEFRQALREYIRLREAPKEQDKVKELERKMIGRKNDGLDFFPTPPDTAQTMVDIADIKEGMKVLEPSAGWGHIAEKIRDTGVEPDVIELSGDRAELLEAKGFNVVGRDFLDYQEGGYDRILMNPPFSDRRDAEHIKHAYDLLAPNGRLVAIAGEGVFFGNDKRAQDFRNWFDSVEGTDEKLKQGTFQDASLPVNTGANARLVVIDKPSSELKNTIQEQKTAPDSFDIDPEDVEESFDEELLKLFQPEPETPSKFKQWFKNSWFTQNNVNDRNAPTEPAKFYHATNADDLTFFDKSKLGSNTKTHATSGLGFFFSKNKGDVARYGKNVLELHLSAQNPLVTNTYDLPLFDSLEEAKQYSKALQDRGYDGIYLKDAGYAIVFKSNQAKLTSNTEPTDSDDIRYSKRVGDDRTQDIFSDLSEEWNDLDRAYFDALERGDMEAAQRMVIEAARGKEAQTFTVDEATNTTGKIRRGATPKKTVKAYRKVRFENGKAYANFVGSGTPIPMGVWLDATEGKPFYGITTNAKGEPTGFGKYVPTGERNSETGKATKGTGSQIRVDEQAIKALLEKGKITQEQASQIRKGREMLVDSGYMTEKGKGVKAVAYRAGFHASELPYFPQGGKKDVLFDKQNPTDEHPYGMLIDANEAIVEVELDMDIDYKQDPEYQPYPVGLPKLPVNGGYEFKTNNALESDGYGWFISGSVKHLRILSPQETDEIMRKHKDSNGNAMKGQKWFGGEPDWESMGVKAGTLENQKKLLDTITYDNNGNIIPLSQRFNPNIQDPRYSKAKTKGEKPYTSKQSFLAAFTKQLDKQFGQGWSNLLMATGKFKVVSSEESDRVISGGELFHRAWHGSPHDHNGFDMSKIGTGEGNQAYGYGLYFAGAKDVAEHYRKTLSTKRPFFNMDGVNYSYNPMDGKYYAYDTNTGTSKKITKKLFEEKQAIDAKGKLYEVELAPTEDEYLLWDKPLSEQSETVKNALKKIGIKFKKTDYGESIYNTVAFDRDINGRFKDGGLLRDSSDKLASEYLKSLGIRGIKYLDGSSRGKGDGNYNYVIFDDADIQIVAKYSKNGKVQAFYNPKDDTTYFVYDNIDKRTDLTKLMLHEIGVHALQLGKDSKEFNAILDEVGRLAENSNSPIIQKAVKAARDAGTKPHLMNEEIAGYLVENHPNLTISQKILAWFKKAIRAIAKTLPTGLQRAQWLRDMTALSESDIVYMATSALRNAPSDLLFDEPTRRNKEMMLSNQKKAERFYSQLKRGIQNAPEKVFTNGQQIKMWLNGNAEKTGIKKDEIYWSGINDWLDMQGKTKLTRDDVLKFLDENGVQVEDVVLGDKTIFDSEIGKQFIVSEKAMNDYEKYLNEKYDIDITSNEGEFDESPEIAEIEVYSFRNNKNITNLTSDELEKYKILIREYAINKEKINDYEDEFNESVPQAKHKGNKLNLPNGKNYRELIITIPTVESWNEDDDTHFGDVGQGKQIAWIRHNTRTDDRLGDGLFLEEVQSQRGSAGRTDGFKKNKGIVSLPDGFTVIEEDGKWNVIDENGDEYAPYSDTKKEAIETAINNLNGADLIPPAPFITDSNNKATNAYISLLLKKAISTAIDNGQNFVAWTTGDQQADRYSLDKSLKSIDVMIDEDDRNVTLNPIDSDSIELVVDNKGEIVDGDDFVGKNLADVIGKDMADKILSMTESQTLKGDGLKIKAGWTQAMYGDSKGLDANGNPALITLASREIAKKLGGKIGTVNLNTGEQPALIITPQMRDKVLDDGMPLFSYAGQKAKNAEPFDTSKEVRDEQGRLLAPNGKPSNLNQLQWHQVRTPEFLNWFGDWINNPENASKVVDENGEPLVVYHGTSSDINIFSSEKIGRLDYGMFGKGFYFTIDKQNASNYAENSGDSPNVMPVYLNIRNPYTKSDSTDGTENKSTKLTLKITNKGFDGRSIDVGYGLHWYVAFNPNQIKSATANTGAFSKDNDDIRYSIASLNDIDNLIAESLSIPKSEWIEKVKNYDVNLYNSTIKQLKAKAKKINDENVFALLKAKVIGKKNYQDSLRKERKKGWFNPSLIEDELVKNGFTLIDTNFGYLSDKAKDSGQPRSYSAYYKNFVSGITARVSDHAPVYARSTGYDLNFYPNSHSNDIDAVDSIKNATANTGAFSKDNDDIRYSIASTATVGDKYTLPAETALQKQQRLWQDENNRWSLLQNVIEENGGTINDSNDVYTAMELMPHKAAAKIKEYHEKHIKPLFKRMTAIKASKDDVALLLYAKHAKERNAEMAKINPRFAVDNGSGMTNAQADTAIAQLKLDYGSDFAELERIADKFQSVTQSTLNTLEATVAVSPEQAQAMRDTYSYYVPLKGFEILDEKGNKQNGTGMGFSTGRTFGKRALGRESKAGQILENILRDHERAIVWQEKTEVVKTLGRLIDDNPDGGIYTKGVAQTKPALIKGKKQYFLYYNGSFVGKADNVADIRRFRDAEIARTGQNPSDYKIKLIKKADKVGSVPAPFDPEKEVRYLQNGKEIRIQIKDPLLLQSFNKLDRDFNNGVFAMAQSFNSFLRQMWTQKNPVFALINPLRDIQTAFMVMTGKGGFKFASRAVNLKRLTQSWKTMWQYARDGQATDPTEQAILERYLAAGGSVSTAYIGSLEKISDDIHHQLERAEGKGFQEIRDLLIKGDLKEAAKTAWFRAFNNKMFDLFEAFNQASEGMTRLATFKAAIEAGYSDNQAAKLASNVTVNFTKKGELSSQLGAMYLFANANIQGNANIIKTLVKGEQRGKAWQLVGGLVMLGFMAALINGDDGDDDLVSDNELERNISIDLGGGHRLNIPLPYGWSFFRDVGRAIGRVANGGDVEKVSKKLTSSFLANYSPIGNPIPQGKLDADNAVVAFAPTFAKPLIMPAVNKGAFGTPLMPESPFNQYQPDSEKAYRKTRGGWQDTVAKTLNELTGGDHARSGWIDISPETIKNTVNYIAGGAGRFLTDTMDVTVMPFNGEIPSLSQIPITKAFAKETTVDDYRRRFYNQFDEVAQVHAQFTKYKTDRDVDGIKELLEEKGDSLRAFKLAERTKDMLKVLRDKEDAARQSGDTNLLDKLEKQEIAWLDRFDRLVNR